MKILYWYSADNNDNHSRICESIVWSFKLLLENLNPFCEATGTPVFDFWCFKVRMDPFAFVLCNLNIMDSDSSLV